jgi:hypothetical protein
LHGTVEFKGRAIGASCTNPLCETWIVHINVGRRDPRTMKPGHGRVCTRNESLDFNKQPLEFTALTRHAGGAAGTKARVGVDVN